MFQTPLPHQYQAASREQLQARIAEVKRLLRSHLVILGHHYQRAEVIQFADFRGDSLELSRLAAQQRTAEFIVFCGVHFMAESADILTRDDQKVILPDLTAGCSMADMAAIDQVEHAWSVLYRLSGNRTIVPICYVNSSAAVKAFCGEHNGLSCTSGNCQGVFQTVWNSQPNAVIFFLPDQHLGRNTAFEMGVALEAMALYDPFESDGDLNQAEMSSTKIVLWDGFCSVHQQFSAEQIAQARDDDPTIQVIVHPECCFEVAQQADIIGSTSKIIKEITASQSGSHWAVGTEINLVNRLAKEMAPKNVIVKSLSDCPCLCETMYRIDLPHLCWVLDALASHCSDPASPLMNRIVVPDTIKANARRALQRMLEATEAKKD